MAKVSFLGDIMCEEPFLTAAKTGAGTYDFSRSFEGLKEILAASDYVVGNLETPLAGEDRGFTHEMYSFNTPDCFVRALREAGVSAVLTANNHCGDRGTEGLRRTVQVLDELHMPHTGTFAEPEQNWPIAADVLGNKIAVLSYTAATNASRTGLALDEQHVNLLKTQQSRESAREQGLALVIKKKLKMAVGEENIYRLRRAMGKQPKKPSTDDAFDKTDVDAHLRQLRDAILREKEAGRIVFVCPHMGGQFNPEPGRLSEYIMDELSRMGADAIVASHPHVVQKAEWKGNTPCFYSLGNVSMSMSTLYILKKDHPEIGLMPHFYIENGHIQKVTFSLLYMREDERGYLYIAPMTSVLRTADETTRKDLIQQAQAIVRRVRRDDTVIAEIKDEFEL